MPDNDLKFYAESVDSVLSALKSSPQGLSEQEALKRVEEYGLNKLKEKKGINPFGIFLRQFNSPVVYLLLAAAGVSYFFSGLTEVLAILAVIIINALIGFIMEFQAIKSMNALKELDVLTSRVIRNGVTKVISSIYLVPGDLVFFEPGDLVSADCRIIKESELSTSEGALTGESYPVRKQTEALPDGTVVQDRTNYLFKGTAVSTGTATAIVTATGESTEFGKIALLLQADEDEKTPLEIKIEALSKRMIVLALIVTAAIALLGIIRGGDIRIILETSISLAVAAIPEGLPIVATIALGYGMHRMAKKNVIVKRLSAVETLGGVNVLLTDKTGTLTLNELTIAETATPSVDSNEELLYYVMLLCNNASYDKESRKFSGDPLEVALLRYVHEAGLNVDEIHINHPRIREVPFNSDVKYMATVHKVKDSVVSYFKGAPEVIIENAGSEWKDGKIVQTDRARWLKVAEDFSAKGYKALGFAMKQGDDTNPSGLVLLGVVAFVDPPREDVPASVRTCLRAGIRIIMVTGDHPATALTIARQIGVAGEGDIAVKGTDLDKFMNGKSGFENISVVARVAPAQKLDLLNHFKSRGHLVAMTGDGINDAPALHHADIGIAMGQRGTQVACEAADIVVKDDSFTSIVNAIGLGRTIYDNIRKFIIYLLSCNLSEIFVVSIASFFSKELALLPLQILFLNLVTDVFPALALGMGKERDQVMLEKPRASDAMIIEKPHWVSIAVYSFVISLGVIVAFLEAEPVKANNYAFYTLALVQLLHIFNMPSGKISFFNNEVTRNIHIWLAVAFCILILVAVYLLPLTSEVLSLVTLNQQDLWMIIGFSFLPVFFIQVLKRTGLIN